MTTAAIWAGLGARWAARRQALMDLLGTRALTQAHFVAGARRKVKTYATMDEAASLLGCSPAAARKRLQRMGKAVRVGGRWIVRLSDLNQFLPGRGRNITTTELVRLGARGRGGRRLSVLGVRAMLKRRGTGRKVGGRWVTDVDRLFGQADDEFRLRHIP